MILAIDTAVGRASLGGTDIPGTITRIYVKGALLFDNVAQIGSSKTEKTLQGFDDADITLNVEIFDKGNEDKSRYKLLTTLNKMFRSVENGSPVTYSIANPHLLARGISQVLFSSLESIEENGYIACTLSFVEHAKAIAKQESAQAKNTTTTTNTTKTLSALSEEQQTKIEMMRLKYGSSK